MPESSSVSPDSTFVVRFRREWSAAGPRWRGWVEHVQSGEDTAFLDLGEMLRFIRQFGAMADNEMLRVDFAKGDAK
jgi:hypothetical protein